MKMAANLLKILRLDYTESLFQLALKIILMDLNSILCMLRNLRFLKSHLKQSIELSVTATGTHLKVQFLLLSDLLDFLVNRKMHYMLLNLFKSLNGGRDSSLLIGENEPCVTPCGELLHRMVKFMSIENVHGTDEIFLSGLVR